MTLSSTDVGTIQNRDVETETTTLLQTDIQVICMSCSLVEATKLMLQICYFHVQFSYPVGKIQELFEHF